MPSTAYLIGVFLFGLLGFAAYRYGKKTYNPSVRWIGLALMTYTYVLYETWEVYLVGFLLCIGLYWFRSIAE